MPSDSSLNQDPAAGLSPVTRPPRFATTRTVMALVLREMTTTYGRSPGGYLWAILEPAAGITLLAVVFSLGFKTPPLGTNFAIFYATGLMPFFMFSVLSTKLASALRYSRQLLSYPRVTIMDALIARFLLTFLTQLVTSYLILLFILLTFDTNTALFLPPILLSFAMATALGAGVGLANCFLTSRFPIWQSIWGVLTRPLLLVSGIIFLLEIVPQPYRDWLWWNPLMHVTGAMRSAFYVSYPADYVDPVYVFSVALICGVTGLLFLRRYYRELLEL